MIWGDSSLHEILILIEIQVTYTILHLGVKNTWNSPQNQGCFRKQAGSNI